MALLLVSTKIPNVQDSAHLTEVNENANDTLNN